MPHIILEENYQKERFVKIASVLSSCKMSPSLGHAPVPTASFSRQKSIFQHKYVPRSKQEATTLNSCNEVCIQFSSFITSPIRPYS